MDFDQNCQVENSQLNTFERNETDDCRICRTCSLHSQLVKPCKCSGTIAFVHLDCLMQWLQECGRNECELCRHQYRIRRQKRFGLVASVWQWTTQTLVSTSLLTDLCFLSCYTPAIFFINSILLIIAEQSINDIFEDGFRCSDYLTLFLSTITFVGLQYSYTFWTIDKFQTYKSMWTEWNNKSNTIISIDDNGFGGGGGGGSECYSN